MKVSGSRSGRKSSHIVSMQTQKALNAFLRKFSGKLSRQRKILTIQGDFCSILVQEGENYAF
jgi:hypothetical protein